MDKPSLVASSCAAVIALLLLASARARRGLFTHEDKFSLHKTLGFACLLSYAYRFALVGERDMGFTSSAGTLASIALHMTLSVSSLVFKIPTKRTLTHYRIWPEYRLHSIVFAWRALLTMLVTWAEGRLGLTPAYPVNTLLVLLCFCASDFASHSVGEAASKSIRDLDVPPVVQFAFSWIQFHGTFNCILAMRRYSTLFVYVWIIQLNAFLMTVQRKNLLSSGPLLCIYAFILVFGYCVISTEMLRVGWTFFLASNAIGNTAAILRLSGTRLGARKYLMWTLFGVFTHIARPTFSSSGSPYPYFHAWLAACALSFVGVGVLGHRKISRDYYAKSERGGWKGNEDAATRTPSKAR
jgi:hypothetical protein